MTVVKRIRYTDDNNVPRVATAKTDEELDEMLYVMDVTGEKVNSVQEVDLSPETLINDILEFVSTDPETQAMLRAKKRELESQGRADEFDGWVRRLIGTIYGDAMRSNGWRL